MPCLERPLERSPSAAKAPSTARVAEKLPRGAGTSQVVLRQSQGCRSSIFLTMLAKGCLRTSLDNAECGGPLQDHAQPLQRESPRPPAVDARRSCMTSGHPRGGQSGSGLRALDVGVVGGGAVGGAAEASAGRVGLLDAEPALSVDTIGPAALEPQGALRVPIIVDQGLIPEPAGVLRHRRRCGACDAVVRASSTESTAGMIPVRAASQHALGARLVVVVRDHGLVPEGAPLLLALDVPVVAVAAAIPTTIVFPISLTAFAAVDLRALRLPIVRRRGRIGEAACHPRWVPSVWRAGHAVVAAEAALHVERVCPTPDLSELAILVPIEGRLGVHHEGAIATPHLRLAHLQEDAVLTVRRGAARCRPRAAVVREGQGRESHGGGERDPHHGGKGSGRSDETGTA
mmetsp:Transcript_26570/g.61463  ORF Transcript_26570/g.61463 Transcript_26570/m.61463 type:complete len:402 (-) Transcript_26570:3-1208(-)